MNKVTVFALTLVLSAASLAHAQWNATGDSYTTGRVMINAGGASTTNDDIVISKSKAAAGMTIFNSSLTGRSVILIGYDYGGKYGVFSHLASSYNAGAGYTYTHKPASTVLAGYDVNGLGLVSSSDIRFNTGGDDDTKFRMIINSVGNVGIGTASPNQKLTVNGTIYGKEVKVDLSVPGPDYVFEKDYKLQSLSELEGYLSQNKHLPEVPSAKEMEANGINLSEMNMLLLKKVEELTLHLIEMKKENEKQNRMIQQLLDKQK